MKKLQVFSLFLTIGILCCPISTRAKEAFTWDTVSDTEQKDEQKHKDDSEKKQSDTDDAGEKGAFQWSEGEDSAQNNDDGTAADKSGQNDTETETDNSAENTDEKDDTETETEQGKASESTDEPNEDAPDEDKEEEEETLKGSYPSESIYSESEIKEMIDEKYEELEEAYQIKDKFKKTKTIDRIDSFILNFCGDPLKGKKIVFLGDSITAGNGGTLTLDGSGLDYTNFIAKYTDASIVNLGIGGAPFEGSDNDDALVHRYTDIPKDADIIVLFAGINDLFAGSEKFGSLSKLEEGTYCGDIHETFQQISKRHPDADVHVIITYPNKMEEYQQFINENWQDYADVQIKLAKRFGFHIINLYEEGFMDSGDNKIRNAFFKDDIHPDDLGSEILGRHILVHLVEAYI